MMNALEKINMEKTDFKQTEIEKRMNDNPYFK